MMRSVSTPQRAQPAALWTVILIVLYCAAVCLVVGYRARSADREIATLDFRDFWLTARHFRLSGEIRDDLGVHNYPPIFTILMTPWSLLPLQPAAVVFTLCSVGFFGWSVLRLARAMEDHAFRVARWALLAVFPYIHATIVLGQVNLIVVALLLAAAAALLDRRDFRSGVCVAIAAAVKVVPAALLGCFLLARRFRAALGCAAAMLVLLIVVPVLLIGWNATQASYARFRDNAVAGHSAHATIFADKPQKAKYSNLAVPIVLRRILTPLDAAPGDESGPLLVNLADWPRERIWLLYVAFITLVGVVTVTATLSQFALARSAPRRDTALPLFGAWCACMLLASPMVWTHHLVMILPALYALVQNALPAVSPSTAAAANHPPSARSARIALIAWCGTLPALAWPAARAAGVPMLGVFVVWTACIRIAMQAQRNGEPTRRIVATESALVS